MTNELNTGTTIEDLMQMADNVITNISLDGEGIPYYDRPDGVYEPSTETEDELEQARR